MIYYPWSQNEDDESFAWIETHPDEIRKKIYRLTKGLSIKHWDQGNWFPNDLVYEIAPDDGIKLVDATPNYSTLLIISERLKSLLESESNASFEFLKIGIKDKKGHIIKKNYFIANLLDTIACVDMEKSNFRMDNIIKTQVDIFKTLVLDQIKIESSKKIFRLAEMTSLIIVREDLAQKILDEGYTGVAFRDISEYGSEYRD